MARRGQGDDPELTPDITGEYCALQTHPPVPAGPRRYLRGRGASCQRQHLKPDYRVGSHQHRYPDNKSLAQPGR